MDTHLKLTLIQDMPYQNKPDLDGVYLELTYRRDRSSFAGIGLRILNKENTFIKSQRDENLFQEVSKYDNLRIGMESDYLKKIEALYFSSNKNYGLEVLFLIYSDVRSSPKVFEELMKKLDEDISDIRRDFS